MFKYSKIPSRKWLKVNFFFEVDFFLRKDHHEGHEDFESLWLISYENFKGPEGGNNKVGKVPANR